MCDDVTEVENAGYLGRRLNRREVGLGAGAALATMLAGCESRSAPPTTADTAEASAQAPNGSATQMPGGPTTTAEAVLPASPASSALAITSRQVVIPMADGSAEGFFVAPKSGQYPGVLMWPDIAGLREAFTTMATRLAGEGYAVLALNHYYRSSKLPILGSFAEWRTEEGKARIAPMKEALTLERIAADGAAFVSWLDQQAAVDKSKKLASAGYCMTGSYTFRTAAAVPSRVGAIASFHGGGLATSEPTSPHLLFSKLKASALVCIAQNDDEREPQAKTTLRAAAEAAKVPLEIEVYAAQHGFCVLDSPVYDEAQAERAWSRMLAMFSTAL